MDYIQSWTDYKVPENYQLFSKLSYGEHADQYIHLAVPRDKKDFPTLIWFHGGGMTIDAVDFDPAFFDGTAAVAAVHYRLAPENLPPAQYEDAAAAIAFVVRNIANYGGNTKQVFVGGLSAGANMVALSVFNYNKYLSPRGVVLSDINSLLLFSGQMTTHFYVKDKLGYPGHTMKPVVDELAPLNWVENATMPIMIVAGELDLPARKYENLFLQDTLRALGNENVETHIIPQTGHGSKLVKANLILDFIKKRCS